MSTPFTPQKQLAFGSIVGSLLATLQREHGLTDGDLVAVLIAMAAGQAGVAKWNVEMFVRQAAHCFANGPGLVRENVPLPPR